MPVPRSRSSVSVGRGRGLVLVGAAVSGVLGCANRQAPPMSEVAHAQAPRTCLAAASVLRGPARQEYVSSLANQSMRLLVAREPTDAAAAAGEPGSGWRVTREGRADADPGSEPVSRRVQTWVRLADGAIALSREENFDEAVIVEFDPPMVIFPAEIDRAPTAPSAAAADGDANAPPNAPPDPPPDPPPDAQPNAQPGFVQETYVTVHPMKNPAAVRVKGPATQRLWYESHEPPPSLGSGASAGPPAARLYARCEIDFGVSRSVNETTIWLDDQLGVLHEHRRERAFALAVKVRDNVEEWGAPRPLRPDDRSGRPGAR